MKPLPYKTPRVPGACWMLCSLFFLVLAPFQQISASALLEFVGSTTGVSGKGARLLDQSASAAYFNPAALVDAESAFNVGFLMLTTGLQVSLSERPSGIDISDKIYGVRLLNQDGTTQPLPEPHPLATSQLPPRQNTQATEVRTYLSLGFVRSLVKDRFALALHALLPSTYIQSQHVIFPDEREQFFSNRLHHELYGDRLDNVALSLGMGGRIMPWLTLGTGLSLDLHTRATTPVYVPEGGNQSRIMVGSELKVENRLTPHYGLKLGPFAGTHVNLTYHHASGGQIQGENRLKFWSKDYPYPEGQNYLPQIYSIYTAYHPMRASAGIIHQLGKTASGAMWEIGGGIKWTQWSSYINRQGESPLEPWSDGWDAMASISQKGIQDHWSATLEYAPSPVPEQIGQTNYVDNDRWGTSIGYSHRWELNGMTIIGGLNLQAHWLITKETLKKTGNDLPQGHSEVIDEFPDNTFLNADTLDKNLVEDAQGLQTHNPGYPGFQSQGWAMGIGSNFKVIF